MFWICGLFLARDMYCASRPPNSCVFKYLLPKELLWMLFIIKVLNKVICLFLGQHWASVWWMRHEMGCPVSICNFYTRQSFILAINPSRAAVLRLWGFMMYRDEKHDSNQTPLPQHTSGEGGQPLYLPWQTAHQPTTAHPDLLVPLPLFLKIHSVVLWTSMAPPLKAVLRMRRWLF